MAFFVFFCSKLPIFKPISMKLDKRHEKVPGPYSELLVLYEGYLEAFLGVWHHMRGSWSHISGLCYYMKGSWSHIQGLWYHMRGT